MITDQLNRPIHDLRISVIDRCNFRCRYCMPEEEYSKHYKFLEPAEWLTFDEIFRVVKLFVDGGVQKVRLTGGEPLLRPRLEDLIVQLSALNITDLALTTNGMLLKEHAKALHNAGLKRLTVSLDTLDEELFLKMSGGKGSVQTVLEGIETAGKAGFESIKINAVIQKNVNERTVLELMERFRGTKHVVRFIEYMDVGNCNHWDLSSVVSSKELLAEINQYHPLRSLQPNYKGEVAERYEYIDGKGEIGFISSVSQPFCGNCSRARISTDGKIFTCLFANKGTDLRHAMHAGASDEKLLNIIRTTWQQRSDRYSEERSSFLSAHKNIEKVEMFQIGG